MKSYFFMKSTFYYKKLWNCKSLKHLNKVKLVNSCMVMVTHRCSRMLPNPVFFSYDHQLEFNMSSVTLINKHGHVWNKSHRTIRVTFRKKLLRPLLQQYVGYLYNSSIFIVLMRHFFFKHFEVKKDIKLAQRLPSLKTSTFFLLSQNIPISKMLKKIRISKDFFLLFLLLFSIFLVDFL